MNSQEQRSIQADVKANPELQSMIEKSKQEYKLGKGMSTSEMMKSFSPEDFR
ncbi:MAG: hypothetical protein ACQEXX_30405 [Bacillota bacterium]